ncbi:MULTISPECIES: VOC family protein [Thalassotalea]|uniref:VOC family protein n=1 Tax=Thalassotalea castellviae TaxID=3075612 RepID=A0ABU3A554_9GAMM|nr:VOC family protein [Thalassotalea sp. W431]MDT0605302.1 VOC family protein [Thalassotalea sp. W431]
MIGYVTLGTNDLKRAVDFYDQLFATIGAGRFMETDQFVAWTTAPDQPGISVTLPFDGQPATVGNGNMVAIAMDSPEKVDAFYKKAIELGATCEGEPGPRGEMTGFYAGYFRDLDGNKLNAFHFVMPSQ